jgi:hypothetical protein
MEQQPALRCSGCSSSAGIRTEEEQQEHRDDTCCTIELSRHVHFLITQNTSIIIFSNILRTIGYTMNTAIK